MTVCWERWQVVLLYVINTLVEYRVLPRFWTPDVDILLIEARPQDCQYWLAYLGIQCRLHELRHKRRISVAAASKILSNLVYSYKGMGLSMGTMCAGVTPQEGPALYYIDSDGTRLAGNLFCVGSGQTFAYGVLDAEYKYDLEVEDALELGRRSILAATHRDAYSGGFINLYHVKEEGWVKHGFNDTNPIFWKTKLEKGEFSNVTSELV